MKTEKIKELAAQIRRLTDPTKPDALDLESALCAVFSECSDASKKGRAKTSYQLAYELLCGPNLPIWHFDPSRAGLSEEIDTSLSIPVIQKNDSRDGLDEEDVEEFRCEGCFMGEFLTIVGATDKDGEARSEESVSTQSTQSSDTEGTEAVLKEVTRARRKFPTWPTDPLHALAVLGEEFGELTKEVLQLTYEPHKSTPESLKTEAIQCAAMAIRFVASLNKYECRRGVQHSQEVETNV